MKQLLISQDILPLNQFKTQASQVLKQLKSEGRPVVITLNGQPAGVLVTPKDFDRLMERERFVASVEAGLRDADAGRLIDDSEFEAELEAEFGPLNK